MAEAKSQLTVLRAMLKLGDETPPDEADVAQVVLPAAAAAAILDGASADVDVGISVERSASTIGKQDRADAEEEDVSAGPHVAQADLKQQVACACSFSSLLSCVCVAVSLPMSFCPKIPAPLSLCPKSLSALSPCP